SNITETGHIESKKSIPEADQHVFLPFDFKWVMEPIINALKPDLVMISEGDLWWRFLKTSKTAGAKIALINGKLSERTLKRWSYIPFFSKTLFCLLDLICVQSQRYQERFKKLGVDPQKMVVTGNTKLDQPYPKYTINELL